jgi:hypothetical protein
VEGRSDENPGVAPEVLRAAVLGDREDLHGETMRAKGSGQVLGNVPGMAFTSCVDKEKGLHALLLSNGHAHGATPA